MKRSRTFWALLAVVLAIAALISFEFLRTPPGSVDIPKLLAATKVYRQQLKDARAVIPAEVPLNQLIAKGLITSGDVSAFAGMKVTVTLDADPHNLRQILMRARLPEGTEIVALNDGSVQQMRR